MFTRKEDEIPTSTGYTSPSTPAAGGNPTGSVRSTANASADANVISKGTRIQGDVFCEGDLRIDGIVTGKIYSKSKVMVGKGGFVDGNIECVQAEIYGKVKGSLTVQDHLFLRAEAKMDGDVLTSHLEMEPTVKFNGKCTMQDKVTLSAPPSGGEEKTAGRPNGNTLNKTPDPRSNGNSNSDSKKNGEKEKLSTGIFQK